MLTNFRFENLFLGVDLGLKTEHFLTIAIDKSDFKVDSYKD